jgi:hypothetical protein
MPGHDLRTYGAVWSKDNRPAVSVMNISDRVPGRRKYRKTTHTQVLWAHHDGGRSLLRRYFLFGGPLTWGPERTKILTLTATTHQCTRKIHGLTRSTELITVKEAWPLMSRHSLDFNKIPCYRSSVRNTNIHKHNGRTYRPLLTKTCYLRPCGSPLVLICSWLNLLLQGEKNYGR